MKSSEEIMEILEAYDLTGSLRGAAGFAGCDHKTVAHYVALRDAGRVPDQRPRRPMLIEEFVDKIQEWMERSEGKIRADIVHDKLLAMGFTGSQRTTGRAVAAARRAWWSGHRRVFRPWVPEPGLWTGVRLAWKKLRRWKWKDIRRHLAAPTGGWHRPLADGIELFNLAKVPITQYRYRGNKIPNPWIVANHA